MGAGSFLLHKELLDKCFKWKTGVEENLLTFVLQRLITMTTRIKGEKQHYVQESYLRMFTDRQGYFYESVLKGQPYQINRTKKVNTGQVCYHHNYYDVTDDELRGSMRFYEGRKFLETKGFSYENKFTNILNELLNKNPYLLKTDLIVLFEAYLSLKMRNPYIRTLLNKNEYVIGSIEKVVEEVKNIPIVDFLIKKGYDYNKMSEDFKIAMLNDSRRGEKYHLDMLTTLAKGLNEDYHDAANELLVRDFVVVEPPSNDYFLTSDNPGFTLKNFKNVFGVYNTEIENFHQVVFPISSKKLIVIFGESFNRMNLISPLRRINYISISSKLVYEFNKSSTYCINSKVFCENEEYLKSFLERRKSE